jgi:hypothetical protein
VSEDGIVPTVSAPKLNTNALTAPFTRGFPLAQKVKKLIIPCRGSEGASPARRLGR